MLILQTLLGVGIRVFWKVVFVVIEDLVEVLEESVVYEFWGRLMDHVIVGDIDERLPEVGGNRICTFAQMKESLTFGAVMACWGLMAVGLSELAVRGQFVVDEFQ